MPENMEDLPEPPDAKPVLILIATFKEVHPFLLGHLSNCYKIISKIKNQKYPHHHFSIPFATTFN